MYEKSYKKLGILGGMGSLATYQFYKNIIDSTPAKKDQDYIDMVILNASYIPDRTNAILYGGKSPLPYLLNALKTLENCGCDLIAIPCNTSHYYFDEMQNSCKSKILNMIELTAEKLEILGVDKTYLMATEGTIKTRVYEKHFNKKNIEIIPQIDGEIVEMMRVIYEVKAGKNPNLTALENIAEQYKKPVVLGCTELSAVSFKNTENVKYIDAMEILKYKILELFGVGK